MKLTNGKPADVDMSAVQLQKIISMAKTWIKPGLHQTIVCLAVRHGKIVFHQGIGSLNPEPDSPEIKLDSIFPMASLSKIITATSIMILVEEGLLNLYRPVSDYIPEFAGEGKDRVMISNLLTHTWGVADEVVGDYIAQKLNQGVNVRPAPDGLHPSIHQYLELGYDIPLSIPPGTLHGYSSYGYELLGEIVRRVSGQPHHEFAKQRISEPLGMIDTHFVVPENVRDRMVRRPGDAPCAVFEGLLKGLESPNFPDMPWALGGAYSTVMDTAIFGQMFLNKGVYGKQRILSPASVASMSRVQNPNLGVWDGYHNSYADSWGHGWEVRGVKKGPLYGCLHSPSTFGHSGAGGQLIWMDPEYDLLGVFFSVELGTRENEYHHWSADLFVNMVTAAIEN